MVMDWFDDEKENHNEKSSSEKVSRKQLWGLFYRLMLLYLRIY